MTVDLATLPPIYVHRGVDPTFVGDELLHAIKSHIDRHPRSQQVELGPSEIGQDCGRRLAYKIAGVEPVNDNGPAWFPTIGTAWHTWGEGALAAENADLGSTRYITETTVRVGEVAGKPVIGHCDVYDRATAGVIDWKLVGSTQLRKYKKQGPGRQYRSQAHLYGRGFQLLGLPVDYVAVYLLPRTEQLDRAYFWHEPYDEQVALDALTRADAIATLVAAAGTAALTALPTADDYCTSCPFFLPGSSELEQACPGHKS